MRSILSTNYSRISSKDNISREYKINKKRFKLDSKLNKKKQACKQKKKHFPPTDIRDSQLFLQTLKAHPSFLFRLLPFFFSTTQTKSQNSTLFNSLIV